jgi:hypothetical protein
MNKTTEVRLNIPEYLGFGNLFYVKREDSVVVFTLKYDD